MFRRANTEQAPPPAPPGLIDAFFDMDKRQSAAESAVSASDQLFPDQRMRQLWDPVAGLCYAATAAYLTATAQPDTEFRAVEQPGARQFEAVQAQLIAASQAVDAFYGAHRTHLEHARTILSGVPGEAQRALAAATAVRHQLGGPGAQFGGYPSVRTAGGALEQAVAVLDGALTTGNAKATRDAATQVLTTAAHLERVLADAPSQDRLARLTLAAVSTRMAAVSTRAERLAPAFSSLLREFNAASSDDLIDNEGASRAIMARAAADLTQAQAELGRGNPEGALDLVAAVRGQLVEAEDLVDAVTDRLDLLRAVRADPWAREKEVRFKLRDAQMLAVTRGIVEEWASVLDAQVERIDRIVGQLQGKNPDYWGYVSAMNAVADFISGVVQRMRVQSPKTPGAEA